MRIRRTAAAACLLATTALGLSTATPAMAAGHYENEPYRVYVCQETTSNTVGGGGTKVCGLVTKCHWHYKKKYFWSSGKEWICS